MRPGRRYWFWSFTLWVGVALSFLAFSIAKDGGNVGDPWVIFVWTVYWALACLGIALIALASWGVRAALKRTGHARS